MLALNILINGRDPTDLNNTFVALIPKCINLCSPKNFRPINLCNVVMKVVTKAIANRIKHIFPNIIDEVCAFVKSCLNSENALIAMECFFWMKKKKKGKNGVMALKFDMSKAYNRIEWDCVTGVLSSMGFPSTMSPSSVGVSLLYPTIFC